MELEVPGPPLFKTSGNSEYSANFNLIVTKVNQGNTRLGTSFFFFFWGGGGGGWGGGFKVGAYSRWALIRGWGLNRISAVTENREWIHQLKNN